MKTIRQYLERMAFGATAEEAVEMCIELAAIRAQQRIEAQIIAALETDDDDDGEGDDDADSNA